MEIDESVHKEIVSKYMATEVHGNRSKRHRHVPDRWGWLDGQETDNNNNIVHL